MLDVKNLGSPEEFWRYFQEISKIPRCSWKEEKIREYIKNEAERFNFVVETDPAGNLIVDVPSNQESTKIFIIQSHMDMVCEKNEDIQHNFSKDPLKLKKIEFGGDEWITAEGTTLGADNGVGLALSLALMDKINKNEIKLNNINLRLIFTVNEESGLSGALHIDKKYIDGDYLVNLDCMDENSIVVGSTDCEYSMINIKIKRDSEINKIIDFLPVRISVSGLLGGHSGIDIHKGRGNAIKILAEVLKTIEQKFDCCVVSLEGGESFNAIPREASADIYIKNNQSNEIKNLINSLENCFKKRFQGYENNIQINIEYVQEDELNFNIFQRKIQNKILNILYLLPFGPICWHPFMENLVHSSTNLGTVMSMKNKIQIEIYQRSFNHQNIDFISDQIKTLLDLADITHKISKVGEFTLWKPDLDTKFLKYAQNVYKKLYNTEPQIRSVHAVLECGIFKNKCPNLEIITLGPTIEACHSPDEKLKISSVQHTWNFLIALLGQIE
ncbi:MAG: beta-Ala-His dipeptidase [Promethearchaeati archaeon]